jgi:hypothetical protein
MRTIFITGLGRSGTTFVDILLGGHPELVAVGEVWDIITLRRSEEDLMNRIKNCTCGSSTCEFWKEVIDGVKSNPEGNNYPVFLRVFEKHFPGKIPVDSSKELPAYYALKEVSSCLPVHVFRDVRGYSYSLKGKTSLRTMRNWYRKNKRMEKLIPGSVKLGYEHLLLNGNEALPQVYKALEIESTVSATGFFTGDIHLITGNRMRGNTGQGIKYDTRWMKNADWKGHLLHIPVLKYNKKRCYSIEKG